MNTTTRKLLAIATSAASLGVGVFSARAINPAEDSQAVSPTATIVVENGAFNPINDTVPVDDTVTPSDVEVETESPIIAPVFVGDDPTILQRLLAGPPAASANESDEVPSYDGTGSEIIGSITSQIAFAQSGDQAGEGDEQIQVRSLPFGFDSIAERYVQFPTQAFDICAGRRPGTSSSVPVRFGSRRGCPVGFAGTLNGLFNWPTPFIRGQAGYHIGGRGGITQTCPASGGVPPERPDRTPVTAFSSIPLTDLRAEVRPYLTSRSWEVQFFPITTAEQTAHWRAERDAGIFTTDALLPHCWTIDRDPHRNYDVRFVGTGIDGNTYTSEIFNLPSRTPARPPTRARILGEIPAATVTAWTVPGGFVRLTTREMIDDSDTSCSDSGNEVDMSSFTITDDAPIDPVYEDWPRRVHGGVLLQYGATLLCAHIFDASGSEIGTDTLVLRTPTIQRPTVTLEAVRLSAGTTIAAEDLGVSAVGSSGLCSTPYDNAAELTGAVPIGHVLWECGLDPGFTEIIDVAVGTSGASPEPYRRTLRSIPVSFDICDPDCPVRPAEYYEVPIPPADGERCSEWEGDFTDECTTSAGVAILRVSYRTTAGAPGGGSATLVSTDAPTEPTPVIRVVSTDVGPMDDWSAIPVRVRIESDNPVTVDDVEIWTTGPDACALPASFESTPGTSFDIDFTVCAGTDTGFSVTVRDDEGFTHLIDIPGEIAGIPDVVATSAAARVEFLGGAAPRFALLERFFVYLDSQNAYLWSYRLLSAQDPGRTGCVSMDTTIIEPGYAPRIKVDSGELSLSASFYLTLEGQPDCSEEDGYMEVEASFSLDQLQSGEPLVATTPTSAWRQMRVTVTGDWHLELDGVRL